VTDQRRARSGGIGDDGTLANQEAAVRAAAAAPRQLLQTTGDERPLPTANGEATSINALSPPRD
jgi:hypothetical protein